MRTLSRVACLPFSYLPPLSVGVGVRGILRGNNLLLGVDPLLSSRETIRKEQEVVSLENNGGENMDVPIHLIVSAHNVYSNQSMNLCNRARTFIYGLQDPQGPYILCLDNIRPLNNIGPDLCLDNIGSDLCLDNIGSDLCQDNIGSDLCLNSIGLDLCLDNIGLDMCLNNIGSYLCLDNRLRPVPGEHRVRPVPE